MTRFIYYYANWNSQCKLMTSILNELQEEFPTMKLIRINNEVNGSKKRITPAVPLIVVEEDEKEVLKLLGFKTKNSLSKIIKEYV